MSQGKSGEVLAWICGLLLCAGAACAAPAVLQECRLVEYLDKSWTHELVTFPLGERAAQLTPGQISLLAPDGQPCPCQVIDAPDGRQIAFLADLPKGATKVYQVIAAPATPVPSDLTIEETPEAVRLANSLTGVSVPTAAGAFRHGPLAGICMRSGRWIGGGQLEGTPEITRYQAQITARGPVFSEVRAVYTFADGKEWRITFRLISGEPVVLVRETCNLDAKSRWLPRLDTGLAPTHGVSQVDNGPAIPPALVNCYAVRPLIGTTRATPFVLHAWLPWWELENASAISLFHLNDPVTVTQKMVNWQWQRHFTRDKQEITQDEAIYGADKARLTPQQAAEATDVLFLAAGHGSLWANPGEDGTKKGLPLQTAPDGTVTLVCPLAGPARDWLLGTSTIERTLGPGRDAYACLNKFLETPLREVTALNLTAMEPEPAAAYPRLFFDRARIAEVGERYPTPMPSTTAGDKETLWAFLYHPTSASEQAFRQRYLNMLATSVARFTIAGRSSVNANTHHVTQPIMDLVFLTDIAFSREGLFTPEERRHIQAQLAFLAYRIASPDFLSPARNYRATANMTTMRNTALVLLACVLRGHPQATVWSKDGLEETASAFTHWIGPQGEWLECPHYQCVNGDLLCMLLAAQRAGLSDLLYDRRFLQSWLYLARISTPPDPRAGGLRFLPPAGNTYRNESTCLFSVLAQLWREKDPAAAEELQWTWIQQGRPRWGVIGGASMVNMFSEFLLADFTPAKAPAWGSVLYPNSGAILRTGFPGSRETHLHLLQGSFVQHYDEDRGSISFWGKGQPLSLDWGYNGSMPGWQHSRMLVGGYWDTGAVTEFAPQPSADYLRSVQQVWHRQIMLVKDTEALGMNYFALCDSFAGLRQPNWWYLWLNTDGPLTLEGNVVHMPGRGDVDLDIWFARDWARKLPRAPAEAGAVAGAESIKPLSATISVIKGALTKQGWAPDNLTQQALWFDQVPVNAPPIFCILYPRLHTEAPPSFTPLAGGCGVRITTPTGVDEVFLSPTPITVTDGAISFSGTCGAIQRRGNTVTLTLGAAGSLTDGAHILTAPGAASKRFVGA